MTLNIDRIFEEIGELGRQQQRYCLALFLLNCYGAFHMLQYTFVGYSMSFLCVTKDQDTPYYNQCPHNKFHSCSDFRFDTTDESTIVSEWNLVCDRTWLGPLTMSAFMAGVMAGALALGSLADSIGRKKTLMFCLISMLAINAASAIVANFHLYTLLKFVHGFFTSGYILCSFVLLNELIGATMRGLVGTALQALFATGIVLFSWLASQVTHWRWLTLVTSMAGLPFLLLHFYLPESPRWLQSKGRIREALIVLKNIAHMNGRQLSEQSIAEDGNRQQNKASKREDQSGGGGGGGGICDLFGHPVLLQLTVIQIFSWFVNSVTYYGLTLAAGNESSTSSRYSSTAVSGIVEIPAYALTIFMLSYLGRKWTLCSFMISGGAALLAVLFLGDDDDGTQSVVHALALFCKLCISASFAVAYIHSGEIFPTTIRNTAMGLVSVAARAGGVASPYMAKLGTFSSSLPNLHLLAFGALTLTSGLLNLRLPETAGQPMPETVDDLIRLSTSTMEKKVTTDGTVKYEKLPTQDQEDEGFV